jgi:UDP-N-acetyl-D-mannosaminuronate dehydrogenase
LEGAFDKGKVGVLGVAYKKDVADDRESPAKKVISLLTEKGFEVSAYDPHFAEYKGDSLGAFLGSVNAVVVCTDHSVFEGIEDELIAQKITVVIDGKNMLDGQKLKDAGVTYRGIGRF